MSTDETMQALAEIEACPPLLRMKAREALIGKEVDWIASFFSGEFEDEQHVFLAFSHQASHTMVFTHAIIADYPWLQLAHRGQQVRLQGRISKIGPLAIELGLTTLAQVAEEGARC